MTTGKSATAVVETTTFDDDARHRRNRLILGIVLAPIGVPIALFLEFMVQISFAWRSSNDGGATAAPQVAAIVVGLLATVPALVGGIRALRDRVFRAIASGATVVGGIGLLAVVLLVVVPAFDTLPRAASDARSLREQQRQDELEFVGVGGPTSAEEAGELMQNDVDRALRTLSVRSDVVARRTWSTTSTTDLGNRCKVFHERISLPDSVDRKRADQLLAADWKSRGLGIEDTDRQGNPQVTIVESDATLTYLQGTNQLLVESDCIPFAAP